MFKKKRSPTFYKHHCGGIIYSDRLIISAAHCFENENLAQYRMVAGSSFRNGSFGHFANVQKIITHEKFRSTREGYDIAILLLESPLPLNNKTIKAIELTDEASKEGEEATTTGWGKLQFNGRYPDVLQEVQVPIISNKDCNKDYRGIITDSMLCAGYRGVGGKDACHGDSGGPLVVNGKLAGVVSWGAFCAYPEYPGVYVNVFNVRPWILDNAKNLESTFRSF